MAINSTGKMSLVAQFDDLCRFTNLLTEGSEKEFMQFVKLVQQWRKQWLLTDSSSKELRSELAASQLELHEWKTNYENLRRQFRDEQIKRKEAEGRMTELQKLFGEVKEVVNRDDTIANQTKERFLQWTRYEPVLPNHVDFEHPIEQSGFYDKTEDDLDLQDSDTRLGKRRSGPRRSGSTPPKRRKSGEIVHGNLGDTLIATTTVNVPSSGNIVATSHIQTYPKTHRRSVSEPEPLLEIPSNTPQYTGPQTRSAHLTSSSSLPPVADNTPRRNTPQTRSTSSLPFRTQLSASKLNTRQHNFVSKTVIRPESCLPCGRRIKFYKEAMKCIDCRVACHPECHKMVPLPCVPCSQTPKNKSERSTVADFAPSAPPMVPGIIIYCVNEIENRGMTEVGLYRVPGSEREVRELRDQFAKGKAMPNVNKIDVNVLCGVIKDFLRGLETLIPRTLWQEFIKASEIEDAQDSLTSLYQAISQLPQANRDTLAYLILHFQRISETPDIKMNVHNIATVLGPTVVGYSSANLRADELMMEQRKQCYLMEKLLRISSDYWSKFINIENDSIFSSSTRTPDNRSSGPESLLGPLRSGSFQNQNRNGKSASTHRPPQESVRRPFRQKFFASPKLG